MIMFDSEMTSTRNQFSVFRIVWYFLHWCNFFCLPGVIYYIRTQLSSTNNISDNTEDTLGQLKRYNFENRIHLGDVRCIPLSYMTVLASKALMDKKWIIWEVFKSLISGVVVNGHDRWYPSEYDASIFLISILLYSITAQCHL